MIGEHKQDCIRTIKCDKCKKQFILWNSNLWRYKLIQPTRFYCSYTCYRHAKEYYPRKKGVKGRTKRRKKKDLFEYFPGDGVKSNFNVIPSRKIGRAHV